MKKLKLNSEQKDLLIGTLLGDGNLRSETLGRTWIYRAIHKKEHKDYLYYKFNILKDLCSSQPVLYKVLDKRTKKFYERYTFNTMVINNLRFYGNLFYKLNENEKFIKDVPLKIEKFLTPRAIAYWYMDDGSLKWLGKSNAMRICTESFSLEGVLRLKKSLKNKYNIEVNITKKLNKGILVGYRLNINEKNSKLFRELIEPYLINCMRYKVSDGNKNHL